MKFRSCLPRINLGRSTVNKMAMDILGRVPVEISHMILSLLSPEELCICSMVSRNWRYRTDCDALWRRFCSAEEWLQEDENELADSFLEEGPLLPRCFWSRVYCSVRARLSRNWMRGDHRRFLIKLQHREPVWSCADDSLVLGYSGGEVEVYSLSATPSHVCTIQAPLDAGVTAVTHNKKYIIIQQVDYLFFYSRTHQYRLIAGCLVSETTFSTVFFDIERVWEVDSTHDTMYIDFIGAGDDTLFVLVSMGLIRISLKGAEPVEVLSLIVPPQRNLYIDDNSLYIFEENNFLTILNDTGSKSMHLNLWEEIVPYKILSNEALILLLCTLGSSHIIQAYDFKSGKTIYTKYTTRPFGVGLHPKRDVVVYTMGERLTVAENLRTEEPIWESHSLFKMENLAQVQFAFVSRNLMIALSRADWHVYDLLHLINFQTGKLLYTLEIEALKLVHANERMVTFFSPERRIEVITFR